MVPESVSASSALALIVREIAANPGVAVRLVGHTDSVGAHEYNVALGRRRAAEIQTALNSALKKATGSSVGPKFSLESAAELQPVAPNTTESGRAQNRRVEVFLEAAPAPATPAPSAPQPAPPKAIPPAGPVPPPGPHDGTPRPPTRPGVPPTTIPTGPLPFDPLDFDRPGPPPKRPDGHSHPIWKVLQAAAGVLGVAISTQMDAISPEVLGRVIGAIQWALENGPLDPRHAIGLAGEMALEEIIAAELVEQELGLNVINLNQVSKSFPLLDLLSPNEAASVKVLGILQQGGYEKAKSGLLQAFREVTGTDWPVDNARNKFQQAAQKLWQIRSQIPKSALPPAIRDAKSAEELAASLKKLVTLRVPEDYVHRLRADVVADTAKRLGVAVDVPAGKGTIRIAGKNPVTPKIAKMLSDLTGQIKSIGVTSTDLRILYEAALETRAKK